MKGYTIRGYDHQDRHAVAHLQRLLWAGGAGGNIDYLIWKYYQNPYLDTRYVLLAWHEGRLVGMVGAFGACWELTAGGQVLLPCLADNVIEPEHRGGPLFARLLDELVGRLRADGVHWLLDFGDQPAAPAMLMRGWRQVGPWPLASATLRGGPKSASGRRSGSAMAVLESLPVTEVAAFLAGLPKDCRIRHVRDPFYLEWRHRNPLARFVFLVAGSTGLDGYLVAHQRRYADRSADPTTITECEAASDEVWADLLEAALALPGSVVWLWARDLTPARVALLRQLRFTLDAPTGRLTQDGHLPHLIVKSIGAPTGACLLPDLTSPSSWDLRGVCGRSWR